MICECVEQIHRWEIGLTQLNSMDYCTVVISQKICLPPKILRKMIQVNLHIGFKSIGENHSWLVQQCIANINGKSVQMQWCKEPVPLNICRIIDLDDVDVVFIRGADMN